MNQVSSIQTHVCNFKYNFTDAKVTSNGGISFAAFWAKSNGLFGLLEGLNCTLKKRRRSAMKAQIFLSHIYLQAMKECHLSDLNDAPHDLVFRVLTSLGEISGSCRVGEFLCCFREPDLVRLHDLALLWLGHLSTLVARHYRY